MGFLNLNFSTTSHVKKREREKNWTILHRLLLKNTKKEIWAETRREGERGWGLTRRSLVSQIFRYLSPEVVVKMPVSCGNH